MAGIGPYRTCRTTLTMSLDRATADFALRIEIPSGRRWALLGRRVGRQKIVCCKKPRKYTVHAAACADFCHASVCGHSAHNLILVDANRDWSVKNQTV